MVKNNSSVPFVGQALYFILNLIRMSFLVVVSEPVKAQVVLNGASAAKLMTTESAVPGVVTSATAT